MFNYVALLPPQGVKKNRLPSRGEKQRKLGGGDGSKTPSITTEMPNVYQKLSQWDQPRKKKKGRRAPKNLKSYQKKKARVYLFTVENVGVS